MRVWQVIKTPFENTNPSLLSSSNLCQEITLPKTIEERDSEQERIRFWGEPGWVISIMFDNIASEEIRELSRWLGDELEGRFQIDKFNHFSFFKSMSLKLHNDEDMALFKLKFSDWFVTSAVLF